MSAASINKLLQKAYQRVGNILGSTFKVYRSVDYLTPIQSKNYLKDIQLAFAVDTEFDTPVDATYKQVNVFADATLLEIGDIFVDEVNGKTLTLVNKDLILRPQGIDTTATISISRPAYTTTGGEFKADAQEVATNIPASILEVKSAGASGGLAGMPSPAKTGIHMWNIWVWMPQNNIKINDTLVDSFGNRSFIQAIEFTPVGYKLTTASTKVGA